MLTGLVPAPVHPAGRHRQSAAPTFTKSTISASRGKSSAFAGTEDEPPPPGWRRWDDPTKRGPNASPATAGASRAWDLEYAVFLQEHVEISFSDPVIARWAQSGGMKTRTAGALPRPSLSVTLFEQQETYT